MQRQELKALTQELRQLALQANATADALERMERFENTEIKWTLSVEEAAVVLDVNVNTVLRILPTRHDPQPPPGQARGHPQAGAAQMAG
ncbi:MAG: hypothetical protein AB1796_02580 [Bacillota bacterium]